MQPYSLVHKPDFSRAVQYWNAFWNGEMLDRPCTVISAPKKETEPVPAPLYMEGYEGNYGEAAEKFDRWASTVAFLGECMPVFNLTFGPDMIAAFIGAELKFSDDSILTSWAVPFVEDWDSVLPLELKGREWPRMLQFAQAASEVAEGRFLLGMLDMHSNMDCLSSIRSPQYLCLDMMDCPEQVDRAVESIRKRYQPIYNGVYEAAEMHKTGTIGWMPVYSPKRFANTQCDFICMMSPNQFRRYVMPALEEEAAFLDHNIFHLDGPEALIHLDDILSIEDIDGIQWVPGAGNAPLRDWMDLLKKIQAAGKSVTVECPLDEIPLFHEQLKRDKLVYITGAPDEKKGEELLHWLVKNS